MKHREMVKRTFTFQIVIAIFAIGLLLLIFCLPEGYNKIKAIALALNMCAMLTLLAMQYFTTNRIYNHLLSVLSDLSEGKIIQIKPYWLKQSKLFRLANRISNRYADLELYTSALINRNSIKSMSNSEDDNVFLKSVSKLDNHLTSIANEAAEWKNKEEIRTWTNQGIAKFSELLRQHSHSINILTQNVLVDLIKYLKINQGGFFLVDKEGSGEPYLNMVASYAYDRLKCPDKRVSMDEGLLAAICHEKKSMYMTDLPENYITIRSGMGDAAPRSLFLVPLLNDNEILGVIELASLSEMAQHERDFVDKVAESIASTLASAQLSETTTSLLEQSRKQAQELAQQEEELRQNMEEMTAQQEEMAKKQKEVIESENLMKRIIDLVPFPIFVKNYQREYIVANQAQAKLFNLTSSDLLGKADDALISNVEELNEIFNSDNQVLEDNQMIKLPEQYISLPNGSRKIMQTIKVPFVNDVTKKPNILGVSIDYTAQRTIEQQLQESKERVDKLTKKLEDATN